VPGHFGCHHGSVAAASEPRGRRDADSRVIGSPLRLRRRSSASTWTTRIRGGGLAGTHGNGRSDVYAPAGTASANVHTEHPVASGSLTLTVAGRFLKVVNADRVGRRSGHVGRTVV